MPFYSGPLMHFLSGVDNPISNCRVRDYSENGLVTCQVPMAGMFCLLAAKRYPSCE